MGSGIIPSCTWWWNQGRAVRFCVFAGLIWSRNKSNTRLDRGDWRGVTSGAVFFNKGQGVCDQLVFVTPGLDRGGWSQRALERQLRHSWEAPRGQRKWRPSTLHLTLQDLSRVQRNFLPGLVCVIEEETAVTGASLLLSGPGFPAVPHPKGSEHKSGKPPWKHLRHRVWVLGGWSWWKKDYTQHIILFTTGYCSCSKNFNWIFFFWRSFYNLIFSPLEIFDNPHCLALRKQIHLKNHFLREW